MEHLQIKDGIEYVGFSHYDRRLFDALIPTPEGTTYNSYIVRGSAKTALIETVDHQFCANLLTKLNQHGIRQLDYIIANHAEQDHSGSIPDLLAAYPVAKLVTNAKCAAMLRDLMPEIPEDRVQTVQDHETLDLGGRTLEFILAPWVHWPETMFTWSPEDKTLFSCDFFGSHLATANITLNDERVIYEPMKRYYAQIMMPYRLQAKKQLEMAKALAPTTICPSHGPIFTNPTLPISYYEDWTSERPHNQVLIPWVSTHGATARMVDHLTEALLQRGIDVYPYDLTVADLGKVAANMVDAATIAIGTSCILSGAHPLAAYTAILANALRPKATTATIFGSYGWSAGKIATQLLSLMPNLKMEIIPPIFVKGASTETTFAELDKTADAIAERHKKLGLL